MTWPPTYDQRMSSAPPTYAERTRVPVPPPLTHREVELREWIEEFTNDQGDCP